MHGTLDKFRWTPHAEARLRALISEKLSAKEAAEVMGVTKNTLIGKANRLGLRFESVYVETVRKAAAERRAKRQPRQKPTAIPPMAPEPNALRLDVLQLKDNSCRFIVTDDHPMLYCGHPKDFGSYCAHHALRVYQPAQARNRMPRPR